MRKWTFRGVGDVTIKSTTFAEKGIRNILFIRSDITVTTWLDHDSKK
jgi:hypothetical protein